MDKGKHYRHSFRLNLTLEDAANGYVTVNLDPYRISDVYGIGGWREHIMKKTLRGTETVSYTHLTLPTTPYV